MRSTPSGSATPPARGNDHFDLVAPALRAGCRRSATSRSAARSPRRGGSSSWPEAQGPAHVVEPLPPRVRHGAGPAAARRPDDFGPLAVRPGEHGGRLLGTTAGSSTASTRLDGDDAVRPGRRGGQHVRPRGHRPRPDHLPATACPPRSGTAGPTCREYCHTTVYFTRQVYQFTPAIEGDFRYGHHYEMFRMAHTFREMVRTRREPVPHHEILEVTAIVHAAQIAQGEEPLVTLEEVMPKDR